MLCCPRHLLFRFFQSHQEGQVAECGCELLDKSIESAVQPNQSLGVDRGMTIIDFRSRQFGSLPVSLEVVFPLPITALPVELFLFALIEAPNRLKADDRHHPRSLDLFDRSSEISDHPAVPAI
jgi:hypothetical protein